MGRPARGSPARTTGEGLVHVDVDEVEGQREGVAGARRRLHLDQHPLELGRVPDQPVLPSWVPTVIGIVLVLMAGLAVYTGLRYRNPTLANGIIKTRRPPRAMTGGGPPGEPEPGASLVFAENAPTAEASTITGSAVMTARR